MQGTKVFLNGRWVGIHRHPDELKTALLRLRRRLTVTEDVSVAYDHALREMRIYNDWGRVCRPLYVVEDSALKVKRSHIRRLLVRLLHSLARPCMPPPWPCMALHATTLSQLLSGGTESWVCCCLERGRRRRVMQRPMRRPTR